jgi:hypothetical protein
MMPLPTTWLLLRMSDRRVMLGSTLTRWLLFSLLAAAIKAFIFSMFPGSPDLNFYVYQG